MRLHRFFVSDSLDGRDTVVIHNSDLLHQLKNVFRFTVGGQIVLFDNSGYDYHALINSFDKGGVTVSVISKKESENTPRRELTLFFSLIKKDNVEWILEKGTELGVSHFVPIVSDRSEKKGFNAERAEKIILEASEQSGRGMIPTLHEVTVFDTILESEFPCFAFDPKGDVFTIEHTHTYSPLGICIGPEGGWTERELFLFKKNNIGVYSLGGQILRAETAAVAVSGLILLQ